MKKLFTLLKIQYRNNKSELFIIFIFSLALFVSGALIQSSISYLSRINNLQKALTENQSGVYFCTYGVDNEGIQELINSFDDNEYVNSVLYFELLIDNEKECVEAIVLDDSLYDVFNKLSLFPKVEAASSNPSMFELVSTCFNYPLLTYQNLDIGPKEELRSLPFGLIYFKEKVDKNQIEAFIDEYLGSVAFISFDELIENTEESMSFAKKQSLFFPCLIFFAAALFIFTSIIIYADRTFVSGVILRSCGASKCLATMVTLIGFGIPEFSALFIAVGYTIKNCIKKGTQFFWEYAYPNIKTVIVLLILACVVTLIFAIYLFLVVFRQEIAEDRKKVATR